MAEHSPATAPRVNRDAANRALVVVNARVWTRDPRRPWADAIATLGDTIAAVGSSAAIRKLRLPHPTLIDAAGATVVSDRSLVAGAAADFDILDRDIGPFTDEALAQARVATRVRSGTIVV